MTDVATTSLHLSNLSIKNFCGIDELVLPRLGRVTLFAGKNSVGKTTVLNAIEVYAARGRRVALQNLLRKRAEYVSVTDEEGDDALAVDWTSLFYGRRAHRGACIVIGSGDSEDQLKIEATPLSDEQKKLLGRLLPASLSGFSWQGLKTAFGNKDQIIPWVISDSKEEWSRIDFREMRRLLQEEEPLPGMKSVSLGTGLVEDRDLTQYWNKVVLTPDEELARQAMGLIFPDKVERIAVVSHDSMLRPRGVSRGYMLGGAWGDRILVKLKGDDQPVPLKGLGEGALRLFSVALALANSRGGFLLIDGAENGIHHSIQTDFWTMVMKTAHENNVQVFAATQSVDCVRGFAYAAGKNRDIDGYLIRLDKDEFGLHPVEYSEENLLIAAEQGIEVR